MTLKECISIVDSLCPNLMDNKTKTQWISNAEGRLKDLILKEYEDIQLPPDEYDPTEGDTKLFLHGHWAEYYVHYVMSQIYLALHEQKHANNEELLYSEIFENYRIHCAQYYKRKSYKFGVR